MGMDTCKVDGCTHTVSKPGHSFCLDHWKAEKTGKVKLCPTCNRWHDTPAPQCPSCTRAPVRAEPERPASDTDSSDDSPSGFLSSTRIGKHFGLSNVKTNLILAELGWIEKYVKGWVPTDRGNALGANIREMRNGTPFVVWPDAILKNSALLSSIAEQTGRTFIPAAPPAPDNKPRDASADFRQKYPATFRAQDGHYVRSRAELLIDNWLYMQGIVHAYERRLPIEENCLCDFYLPGGKGVYIEFWGRESDPTYQKRKTAKQAIYAKHGLRLMELGDADVVAVWD